MEEHGNAESLRTQSPFVIRVRFEYKRSGNLFLPKGVELKVAFNSSQKGHVVKTLRAVEKNIEAVLSAKYVTTSFLIETGIISEHATLEVKFAKGASKKIKSAIANEGTLIPFVRTVVINEGNRFISQYGPTPDYISLVFEEILS